MKAEFNIVPMGAVRQTRADAWRNRPCVLRYRSFKDSLREQAAPYYLPADPLIVTMKFYIPMPASWSKKKKAAMNGAYHRQKPDIDNLSKSVMDSLWEDDSMISKINATKLWSEKGKVIMEVSGANASDDRAVVTP